MNPISDILAELEALSPVIAAIPRTNVYSVPEGYFNQLSDNVLSLLQPEMTTGFGAKDPVKLSVPEGYFDGLADTIMDRIRKENISSVQSETNNISQLVSSIGKTNVFGVPQGYFEKLTDSVLGNINANKSESVQEEITKLAPSVAAIGNQNVFTVPEAYFESLDFLVMQRIPVPAKVVEMPRRKSIIRYMAAAVITGLIGISLFSVFDNKSAGSSAFPDAQVMAEANKIISTNSFESELASISGQDIEAYLKENGQDVNAALVASVTDDVNALPGSEEYLINENTLDEFLNKMNLNN